MKRKLKVDCHNAPVKFESHKRKRVTGNADHKSCDDDDDAKSIVLNRAREIQANLSPKSPSMIKYMKHSHVAGGFWLGLPARFCEMHMPKEDTMMILIDEDDKQYEAKYLTAKKGLSGGWRGFSIAHNLAEGDAVAFELIKPTTFQVYIVRANGQDDVDGALGLLELDNYSKSSNSARSGSTSMEDLSYEKAIGITNCNNNLELVSDQSEDNNGDDLSFEAYDGIRMSDSIIHFKDVKAFEDFDITVNSLVLNSELAGHIQSKYYDLCCSQNSFLHQHLLEGLNYKLTSGVIAETTNIADAIRAAKLTVSQDYTTWKKTLEAFEKLGMDVGFLITRLDKLMAISAKFDRYMEVSRKRSSAVVEKETLETKLIEIKQKIKTLDSEMETFDGESCELMFNEIVKAPW